MGGYVYYTPLARFNGPCIRVCAGATLALIHYTTISSPYPGLPLGGVGGLDSGMDKGRYWPLPS